MAQDEIKVKSLKKALDVLNCFLVKPTRGFHASIRLLTNSAISPKQTDCKAISSTPLPAIVLPTVKCSSAA